MSTKEQQTGTANGGGGGGEESRPLIVGGGTALKSNLAKPRSDDNQPTSAQTQPKQIVFRTAASAQAAAANSEVYFHRKIVIQRKNK